MQDSSAFDKYKVVHRPVASKIRPMAAVLNAGFGLNQANQGEGLCEKAKSTFLIHDLSAKAILEQNRETEEVTAISSLEQKGKSTKITGDYFHFSFVDLAFRMQSLQIVGGTARGYALLQAAHSLINDFNFSKAYNANRALQELSTKISLNYQFLTISRPPSAAMQFVLDEISEKLDRDTQLDSEATTEYDPEATKKGTIDVLYRIADTMVKQGNAVVSECCKLFGDNDVIVVYGRSSLIERALLQHQMDSKNHLTVYIVDSGPLYEGRGMLKRLLQKRKSAISRDDLHERKSVLELHYQPLGTISIIMPNAKKVIISASTVRENGDVISRCGTSIVASMAKYFNKPVLCACENYKLRKAVSFDYPNNRITEHLLSLPSSLQVLPGTAPEITRNRYFDPAPLFQTNSEGKIDYHLLTQRNPYASAGKGSLYDLTPSNTIDALITQTGLCHHLALQNII